MRQNAGAGDIVTVQGVVTSPTGNFFDALYIQDETGGICLYGDQGRDLPVGTVVIATGGVQYFEGELELAYENAGMEVLYVGPGTPVQPLKLSFSPETLSWVKQQIATAREEGKLVIGMMHHGLIDHFSVQRQFFPEYIVQDADRVASELADSGLQVVFNGHFHAQDIVKKQFGNKALYDIETGSLVTYPCPYRVVE